MDFWRDGQWVGNPEKGLWCSKEMGPVNYLSAKNETLSNNVKLDKKDEQSETTMKTNEGLEPENNDTRKTETSNVKPIEKEGATTAESSDYFLSQNNQE